MPRVVSLLPSSTEIVCALGQEAALVGRSRECDYPQSILDQPVCTHARIDCTASSGAVDDQVKDALRRGLALYEVKNDLLESLEPDVILTQDLCEVCAVSLKEVEAAVCRMSFEKPIILTTNPRSLSDVWEDIRRIAEVLEVTDHGEELVRELKGRVRDVSARANGWGRRPAVACLEWLDPLMAAGNWMPELVELAGGVNLFGQPGKHSPWISFDELYRADPDVIVVMPCGFDLRRTREEMVHLTRRSEWSRLRAAHNGRVHVADGNAFFNRPGPRLVEAVEMLAEAIQPAAFSFGHEGIEVYNS